MGRYSDLADRLLKDRGRILDGHQVATVIWETEKAVIFQDEAGAYWRYLHDYVKAWPVIVKKVME